MGTGTELLSNRSNPPENPRPRAIRATQLAARWDVVDTQAEGSVGLLNREQLDGARLGTAGGTDRERDRRRALVVRKVGNDVDVVVAEREVERLHRPAHAVDHVADHISPRLRALRAHSLEAFERVVRLDQVLGHINRFPCISAPEQASTLGRHPIRGHSPNEPGSAPLDVGTTCRNPERPARGYPRAKATADPAARAPGRRRGRWGV